MLTQLGYAAGIILFARLGDRYDRRLVILVKLAALALTLLGAGAYGRDTRTPRPEPAANADPKPPPRAPRTALGAGLLDPSGARIPWADLLRRIHLEDVLACPCGGRRRVVANIDDPVVVSAILSHLGLPTEAPPVSRARGPTLREA